MGTAVQDVDGLWLRSPAVRRADWLATGTQFEELNELHAEHQALRAEMAEKRQAVAELEQRYEAEDESGGKRTPASKRADTLGEARHEAAQLAARLKQFIADAIATVQEHEDEWCEVLREQEAEGRRRVEEARRAYLQAKAEAEQAPDLRVWIERTATAEPVRLINWGWFGNKPSSDTLAIANRGFEHNPPSQNLMRERQIASNGPGSGGVVDGDMPDFGEDVADYSSEEAIAKLPEDVREAYRKRMAAGTEQYDRQRQQALEDHIDMPGSGQEGTIEG